MQMLLRARYHLASADFNITNEKQTGILTRDNLGACLLDLKMQRGEVERFTHGSYM
jgi:hypothetical protein